MGPKSSKMDSQAVSSTKARSILKRMTGLFAEQRPVASFATAFNETRSRNLAAQLEVADNSYTRRKGLLGRDGLPPGAGLWIFPCESVHTFAMRFPIDLVYLDRKLVVRKVRSNVPPGKISVCFTAHSVIELPAGTAVATGTRPGDHISIVRET